MQITQIKSERRPKTCYKRAIFTELQQIKNYAKLVAKGQSSCWNMAAPLGTEHYFGVPRNTINVEA